MVTGAAGFVGHAILRALAALPAGARRPVIAIGTAPGGPDQDGVEWYRANLLDRDAMRAAMVRYRPQMLIHAAWARTRPGGLWDAADNRLWVDASLHLFEAFWAEGGTHLAACGTCAEYAACDAPCDPDATPIAPTSLYGQAKARLFDMASHRAAQLGMPLGWGRLFYLFGPHEGAARLVPSVIDALIAGRTAETGMGLTRRDFALVDDIGAGLVALAQSAETGAFNIASGHAIMLRDLVARIGALMDAGALVRIGARPDRANEAPLIVADMAKTHDRIGWRATTALNDALIGTIAWRRANAA